MIEQHRASACLLIGEEAVRLFTGTIGTSCLHVAECINFLTGDDAEETDFACDTNMLISSVLIDE